MNCFRNIFKDKRVSIKAARIGALAVIITSFISIIFKFYLYEILQKKTIVEIVDVLVDDKLPSPTLDIKLRNKGEKIAYLRKVFFNILGKKQIKRESIFAPATGNYNIILNKTQKVNISHVIQPNSWDRFQLKIAEEKKERNSHSDLYTEYTISLSLFYNKSDFVETPPFSILLKSSIIKGSEERVLFFNDIFSRYSQTGWRNAISNPNLY